VRDPVFRIRFADGLEPKLRVEPFQVLLRGYSQRLSGKKARRRLDAAAHDFPAQPGTARLVGGQYPADRGFGKALARRQKACVGQDRLPRPGTDVQSTLVEPVEILVGAILLNHENRCPGGEDGVESHERQFAEALHAP